MSNTNTNVVAANSIQTQAVRMFANFSKNVFIPLLGDLAKPDALYQKLKDEGANLSRHTVHALLEGKEKLVRGFEVVDVPNHHVSVGVAKRPETGAALVGMIGYQPAGPVAPVARGSVIAKGMELLKDGITIEELREELHHEDNAATRAFLAYRPKKRGYGVRFDMESKKYFLVMAEGQNEIAYKK
jgi:hypothetical protein